MRLRSALTGGGVPGVLEDRSARCFHSQVWIAPERPPMIGTWYSAPSCGTKLRIWRSWQSRAKYPDTVRWTCVHISRSASMKMRRFLMDVTGETWTPSIDNAVVGSGCWLWPVVHQRTSVLSQFNCSLLDHIQLKTTLMHSESFAENASTSTYWQKPYTWVINPLSSINDIRSAV